MTLIILFLAVNARSQDSTEAEAAFPADTVTTVYSADSLSLRPWPYTRWEADTLAPIEVQVFQHHPYFGFNTRPVVINISRKQFYGKDILFYVLIGLLLSFALLREAFPKYFSDLFRLFFRTTLKQRQIREQLVQAPFPSLLLNIFFVVNGGMYIAILLNHFGHAPVDNFWLLLFYGGVGLAAIYAVKFIGLKLSGWLFNMPGAADAYIFVVFVTNKILGIFLLPFLILLSFMDGDIYTAALVVSWCGIGILIIYRFLMTYASIRNQVRFNPFHFLLYLCAFEIAPLLLIYKGLLFFFP